MLASVGGLPASLSPCAPGDHFLCQPTWGPQLPQALDLGLYIGLPLTTASILPVLYVSLSSHCVTSPFNLSILT